MQHWLWLLVIPFCGVSGYAGEHQASARLKQLGAHVFTNRSGTVIEVTLNNNPRISDGDLELLNAFSDLADLSLENTKISDAGIQRLKKCQKLEWLNLYRTQIGDAALKHLAAFPNLKHLPIGETRITDTGLKHLTNMSQLVYLGLRGTSVGDAGLRHVHVLTNLTGLHLGATRISNHALTNLPPSLEISGCTILLSVMTQSPHYPGSQTSKNCAFTAPKSRLRE